MAKCPTCGKPGFGFESNTKKCPHCGKKRAYFREAFGTWICYACRKEWK